jgi:hypothetical protein
MKVRVRDAVEVEPAALHFLVGDAVELAVCFGACTLSCLAKEKGVKLTHSAQSKVKGEFTLWACITLCDCIPASRSVLSSCRTQAVSPSS